MSELHDVDHRSKLFLGLTSETLARHTASFVRTVSTPAPVAELLSEARRTFVGAAACYDNFASSAFKSLQAAELALRLRVPDFPSRSTLGQLVYNSAVERILTPELLEWYRGFALHFRNELAHPNTSVAMTPGMAEPFVRTSHDVVAKLYPDD